MGKDRYLVAHTSETLLLGDLLTNKLSEVGPKESHRCSDFLLSLSSFVFLYYNQTDALPRPCFLSARCRGLALGAMRSSSLKMKM